MNQEKPNVDMRYRTLLTLWFGICMSVVMFLVFVWLKPVEAVADHSLPIILGTLGLVPFALSFLLKQKILEKSAAAQRLDLVQSAYVLSFGLCEIPALLSVISHFLAGSTYYHLGFIVAGIGLLLHFPRKQHLLNATFKQF